MTMLNGQFCPIDSKMCFDGNCGHCETYKDAQRKPHCIKRTNRQKYERDPRDLFFVDVELTQYE